MRAWIAALACVLCACAPDFSEEWEVDQPRIMGWRVEVDGDPTRPRPMLGEKFSLHFYVSLPSGNWPTPLANRYGIDLSLCLGLVTNTGVIACLGEQSFQPVVTAISDQEVVVSNISLDLSMLGDLNFSTDQLNGQSVDPASPLAQLDQLALIGVFCVDGTAQRVPDKIVNKDPTSTLYECVPSPGASYPDKTVFVAQVYFERGLPSDPNRNPSFDCDPSEPTSVCNTGIKVGDEALVPGSFVIARPAGDGVPREVVAWPARAPDALPWDNCASDPTLLQVRAKSGEHVLRARFDPSDREQYQYTLIDNGQPELRTRREPLLLTHAVTLHAGDLARFESELQEGDADEDAEISFRWTPPEKGQDVATLPDTGRLVRFYFTLRDERGGVDFTTRELCLLPALRGE